MPCDFDTAHRECGARVVGNESQWPANGLWGNGVVVEIETHIDGLTRGNGLNAIRAERDAAAEKAAVAALLRLPAVPCGRPLRASSDDAPPRRATPEPND